MRVGFIWNTISDEEYQLASDIHSGRRELFKKQFAAVDTLHLSTQTLVDTFTAVLNFALVRGLDFCLLSHRCAWAIDPERMRELFESEGVEQGAIAVRAGKIYVKAGVFSPKAPYIDFNFIIINVRRCAELDILQRIATVSFASHFFDAGGMHADLLAFLETIVPYGGVHVYDDGSQLRDIYGRTRTRGFAPTPYLVDVAHGFIYGDPIREERVHILRSILLHQHGLEDMPSLAAYVQAHAAHDYHIYTKDGVSFLKESFVARCAGKIEYSLKHTIQKVNFEIHKKYEDRA